MNSSNFSDMSTTTDMVIISNMDKKNVPKYFLIIYMSIRFSMMIVSIVNGCHPDLLKSSCDAFEHHRFPGVKVASDDMFASFFYEP